MGRVSPNSTPSSAAWDAYSESRKSPLKREAGEGFADPEYEIATDWLAAREAIVRAQRQHDDQSRLPSILLINGSPRSESNTARADGSFIELKGVPS